MDLSPPRPPERPTGRSVGRIALSLGAAVATLVLLLAALTWGPHLFRERIAARIGEGLGRSVEIGGIEVSPWAGRVAIVGLTVAAKDRETPTVRIDRATVELDLSGLLRGRWVVNDVHLERPELSVVRLEANRLDVSDILERFGNEGGPPSESTRVWQLKRARVTEATLVLDDRFVAKRTALTAFDAQVVDLSNRKDLTGIPANLEASARLDDRPVSVQATATLFAPTPSIDARATLDALPLAAVRPYLPLPSDLNPTAALLSLDLTVGWRPPATPPQRLSLQGQARLDGVAIADAAGRQRLSAASLAVTLAESHPLGGPLHLTELVLREPGVQLGRRDDGTLEWPRRAPGAAQSANRTAERPASNLPSALRIDSLAIEGGRIHWDDASGPVALQTELSAIRVALRDVAIADLARPGHVDGAGLIEALLDGQARVQADLALRSETGIATITLTELPVARYAPLIGPQLKAQVAEGRLDAKATLGWQTAAGRWSVSDGTLALRAVALEHSGRRPIAFERLALEGIAIDPPAREVAIGAATLDGAALRVRRDRAGRIDLQTLFVPGSSAGPADGVRATEAKAGAWTLRVGQARVGALTLDYADASLPQDRQLPPIRLSLAASNLTLDPSRPFPFEASAGLPDGSSVSVQGTLRPQPLALDARLGLRRLELTHFDPFLAPYLNLSLAAGELWSSGRLTLASRPDGALDRIGFDGEFSANGLRAVDAVSSDDFLRWAALAMPSVRVDWRPGRLAASEVEIGEVAFVDFYTRVILTQEGRLNLGQILARREDAGGSAPSLTRPPQPGQDAASRQDRDNQARHGTLEDQVTYGIGPTDPGAAKGRRSAVVKRAPGEQPGVRIGTVRIASGNVDFTDLFIRPNYTARLTDLSGSIEAIASDRDTPSDVIVTGRIDSDTPLEITGKINPLAPRAFIDLRAVARGLHLPKLSPYSGRWAGYAIEKGKLTADVRYRIVGDALEAENRLTLNQLTFGEKVDSPEATPLPVRFAVSLLKDREGNIDLDLPISGTLSDPQFSIGGLLWRAIGNLVARVVTSPFTLLSSLGGGEAVELSRIEFGPGAAALDDEDRRRLDGLARALDARPGLRLEIIGFADPKADREALEQAQLERTLRLAKLGAMRRSGRTPVPAVDTVTIEETERAQWLEQAWRDAGFARDAREPAPSSEEIARRLAEAAPVGNEALRDLAQRRARAAHDHLRDTGRIADERLFLVAPRVAEGEEGKPPRRVEFTVE